MLPYHNMYVEVFGGGGSLLFTKRPSFTEVYNDINNDLWNFFYQLKKAPEALRKEIDSTPVARRIFEEKPRTDLERAVWFFLRKKASVLAKGKDFDCFEKDIKTVKDLDVSYFANRLKYVAIENRDFEYIFKRYDKATTLFYCDPPYHFKGVGKLYGEYDWEDDDIHERLYESIAKTHGKFILSYNDCEYVRNRYKDYHIKKHEISCTHINTNDRDDRTSNETKSKYLEELIIWNF